MPSGLPRIGIAELAKSRRIQPPPTFFFRRLRAAPRETRQAASARRRVLQWLQIAPVVCARARALLPAWVRAAQPADATALETVLLHGGTGTVCWCCRCTLSSVGHGTDRSGVEPWRFPRRDGSVSLAGPRETRPPQFSSRSAAARRVPGGARTGALMGHLW